VALNLQTNPDTQSEPVFERRWDNPYLLRRYEFPERIFTFEKDSAEADLARVRALAAESNELICELGSGSGRHLIELGARNPSAIVFGFERRYKRAVRTIEKALARNVANVFVLNTDSFDLAKIFREESVVSLHINFPDPWDRRRSHKHRMLSERMLDSIRAVLRPGGSLSVKTDHAENFANITQILSEAPDFSVSRMTQDLHQSPYLAANILTEFEELFVSKGLPIFYVSAQRKQKTQSDAD